MNRPKKITILLCVLLVLCAATFGMSQYEEKKEQIRSSDTTIMEILPEEVQTLSWSYDEETLSFHKDVDGKWRWDEDDSFPVDTEVVADYLEIFQKLGAAFVIENVEDYDQYGLTEPECTIRFTTDEQEYIVKLGSFSKMDSQRYASIEDGNAYLLSSDPLEEFQVTIRDMIDNDQIPNFDRATKIKFTGAAGYTVSYEEDSVKTYCAEDVYFTGDLPLDTDRVKSYVSSITGLNLSNYATYNATQEELEAFGMDSPELTVTVEYSVETGDDQEESGTFTLSVSRDPQAVAQAEAAEAAVEDGEEAEEVIIPCYLRLNESPIVYEISESLYNTLTKVSYNDLRHKDLLTAEFEDITQVDITIGEDAYTLTTLLEQTSQDGETTETAPAEDDEIHWYYNGEEIKTTSFKSAIINLIADSFTEEVPTQQEEISAVFHLNNENFPTVTLQFYRYDGSDCIAVVDGEPTALIDRVYVIDLIEAVLAIVLN